MAEQNNLAIFSKGQNWKVLYAIWLFMKLDITKFHDGLIPPVWEMLIWPF